MDLVERYLQAVQFWLPANLKRDIIAELSEDLHAQIEERAAELGRNLNSSEIEDLLKQRGAPMKVANQYLPQRSLIGPLLFPVYLLVLKIVFLGYLVPWVLTFVGLIVFNNAYRAGWVAHSWLQNVTSIWSSLWSSAFLAIGVVTLVFAVLERVQPQTGFLENFNPRTLPPVRNHAVIPRVNSSFELGVQVIGAVWIACNLASPVVYDAPNVRITLAPHWYFFFLGWLLVVLASAMISAANLLYPYWTRRRALLRFLSECAGSILFCWMMSTHILAQLTVTGVSPERTALLVSQINYWAAKSVPFGLAICLIFAISNAWLNLRGRGRAPYPDYVPHVPR